MWQRIARRACAGLLLFAPLIGCGLLRGDKLERCRSESEQLLSDYRQQRDRAERLELENRTLHEQIANVEKKLALASKSGEERLAARPDAPAKDSPEQPSRAPRSEQEKPKPPVEEGHSAAENADPSRETDQSPPEDDWRSVPRS